MDLLGRLPDQEQPAGHQDQVAPGKGGLEARLPVRADRPGDSEIEHRRGQPDQPGDSRKEDEAHDQGQADAQPARLGPHLFGQLVRQDRDEDQVVDSEHHFEHDQGGERDPGFGVGENGKGVDHGCSLFMASEAHGTKGGAGAIAAKQSTAKSARGARFFPLCESPARRQTARRPLRALPGAVVLDRGRAYESN